VSRITRNRSGNSSPLRPGISKRRRQRQHDPRCPGSGDPRHFPSYQKGWWRVSRPVHSDPREIAWAIMARAQRSKWSDYDPYDGLSGFAFTPVSQRVLSKRILTQVVMRTSPCLRRLLGIPPHVDAYTLGILSSTAAVLGDAAIREFGTDLIDGLASLRVADTGAWGYAFPVVTRAAQYGPDTPNLISTAYASLGLFDLIEASGDGSAASELALDATSWVVASLWDDDLCGFRYHRGSREFIYNASILGALVVARSHELLGIGDPGLARRAGSQVIAAQAADGSWPYGQSSHLNWVDNHHTAFILKALLLMPEAARPPGWRIAVERGFSFFLEYLLATDGAPKPAPDRRYPLDGLAAGQTVETLALASAMLGEALYLERANTAFEWTEDNLRRRDGRYRFRRGRYFNWPGAYLRWGEVHIALGAARLSNTLSSSFG
jgi:hypothetical protein